MTEYVQELVTLLTHKEQAMQRLWTVLQDEQHAIVELNLTALECQTKKKEEISEQISALGGDLRLAMNRVGLHMGLEEGCTLSSIIAGSPASEQNTLHWLQNSLFALSMKVNHTVTVNWGILESSLKTINNSMAFFTRMIAAPDTYSDAGRMISGETQSSIVRRKV